MKISNTHRVIKTILKDIDKGKILLNHPVQREPGQFNRGQKTLLIDSLLRQYPIPNVFFYNDDTNTYVIDGLQRLTIFKEFIEDGFKLGPNHEPITYEVISSGKTTTQTCDVSGKKFSKLPSELQDLITDTELSITTLEKCTDEEINNVFLRLNNGTPLNTSQKLRAVTNNDVKKHISKIKALDLFTKYTAFSNTQRIKGADEICVIQTLMLTKGVRNFTKAYIESFVKNYVYNKKDFDKIEKAAKELQAVIKDDVPPIPRISLPMILTGYMSCDDTNRDLYVSQINDFLDNYENEHEYRALCKAGTTNECNIVKRIEFFENMK